MSKFTDQEKALEATRCKTCWGVGRIIVHGGGQRDTGRHPCPDCDDGIVVDPFEKYWRELSTTEVNSKSKYHTAKDAWAASKVAK